MAAFDDLNKGLGEGVKKFLLVGIGAAATSMEKSQEILDSLVKKGELTVEQGKELNQELKHSVDSAYQKAKERTQEKPEDKPADFEELVKGLSPEQLAELSAQIEKAQKKD